MQKRFPQILPAHSGSCNLNKCRDYPHPNPLPSDGRGNSKSRGELFRSTLSQRRSELCHSGGNVVSLAHRMGEGRGEGNSIRFFQKPGLRFPRILSLIAIAALSAILSGCGNSIRLLRIPIPNPAMPTPAKPRRPGTRSACRNAILGEPWRVQMNADIRAAAAKHPELKVIFKDAQNDTLQQRAQVGEFVQPKVNIIIISPKEAQPLTDPVAQAMDAGIPVIVLDRRLLGTNYTCFIGANNKEIGKAAGKMDRQRASWQGQSCGTRRVDDLHARPRSAFWISRSIAGTDIEVIFGPT